MVGVDVEGGEVRRGLARRGLSVYAGVSMPAGVRQVPIKRVLPALAAKMNDRGSGSRENRVRHCGASDADDDVRIRKQIELFLESHGAGIELLEPTLAQKGLDLLAV